MSESAVEYTELTPVFFGSYVEAVALRSALEAYGFETFLPSENIKIIDPFVTGANALDVRLDAPAAVADEVKALIEELRPGDRVVVGVSRRVRTGWFLVFLWMAGIGVAGFLASLLFGLWRLLFGG